MRVTVLKNSEKSQMHSSFQVNEAGLEVLALGRHFVKVLGYVTSQTTRVVASVLKR